jgi:hypothetical protein
MDKAARYLGQALLYALFFVPLVFITQQPAHRHLGEEFAVLKIAVRHAGEIVGECTPIDTTENANRPINMQRTEICPRERSPLQLALLLDGATLYRASVPASGLHNDGISSMYQRFNVPAGSHHVQLLMNDNLAVDGYTWQLEQDIQLRPAQVMVASFKEGFRLQ